MRTSDGARAHSTRRSRPGGRRAAVAAFVAASLVVGLGWAVPARANDPGTNDPAANDPAAETTTLEFGSEPEAIEPTEPEPAEPEPAEPEPAEPDAPEPEADDSATHEFDTRSARNEPPSGVAVPQERTADVVTADSLPTVQIDSGIVWTQAVVGNIVFAGGSFSHARPTGAQPGVSLMPRKNLLSYNIHTGVATNFAPDIEGTVKALEVSPDQKTLYVGGTFKRVNGEPRHNIAAFDVATGQLVKTFAPAVGGSYINAIVATPQAVYFGGLFTQVRGVSRKNLGAVEPTRGRLLGWAPTTNQQIDGMTKTASGDKIIAAGRFSEVSGATQTGTTALHPTSGAILSWEASTYIQNGEGVSNVGIWGLAADDKHIYGTGWSYGEKAPSRKIEGVFAVRQSDGGLVWQTPCKGDTYDVTSDGKTVYSVGHPHDCRLMGAFPEKWPAPGNMRHAAAFTIDPRGIQSSSGEDWFQWWKGTRTPALITWWPEFASGQASGSGQAGWSIEQTDEYVVIGGEFPAVNNQRQQGLARFAKQPYSGANQGPRLSDGAWVPTATSSAAGSVTVTIPMNHDRDNGELTYDLLDASGRVLTSRMVRSYSWLTDRVTLSATGLAHGSSQTLRVTASDRDGNIARSATVTVTVRSS